MTKKMTAAEFDKALPKQQARSREKLRARAGVGIATGAQGPQEDLPQFKYALSGMLDESILEERADLTQERDFIEERIKQIDTDIKDAYEAAGVKKTLWGTLPITLCNGRSASRISKTKLVEAGVDADVIAACTESGTPYTYIRIGKDKKEEDSNDGSST
jgi:hypothetical protein